ncbi:pyridoxal phosphate-dependent aminotransferase [Atopobium fossor]|uniref:pyridoxal phosphate-dependent aminotransferase n=1 Tax=Atopobium fossor TaxID=39487 RepID=UPI0004152E40|nr:pyridoxal phosphate-dependent aminotransferase [Atopobium fossor]
MRINQKSYDLGAAKSSIREIAAYAAKRRAELGADKVFDFSIGNPSVPAPAAVGASIQKTISLPSVQVHGYTPAAGLPEVKEVVASSLCHRFGAQAARPQDLYLTCGAAASISITLHAISNPGDEVVVITPYFPEYRVWIEHAGATCVEVPSRADDFQIDVTALRAALTQRTKAVIINSPNNPVGTIYSAQNLAEAACVLRECSQHFGTDILLLADEPYREITYGLQVPWVPDIYANTVVCYSYSKSLSLPGERVGWILVPPTNPNNAQLIPTVAGSGRSLGFVCAPALFQRVIADCVDEPSNVEAYDRNRRALTEGLHKLGYTFVEPQGAFYLWLKALEPDARAFYERCRTHELLPVPSNSFGCTGWVRLGYCVPYQTIINSMDAWAAVMKEYQNEL